MMLFRFLEEVVGLEIGTLFDSLLVVHINIEGAISCRFAFLKLKVGLCVFGKGVGQIDIYLI